MAKEVAGKGKKKGELYNGKTSQCCALVSAVLSLSIESTAMTDERRGRKRNQEKQSEKEHQEQQIEGKREEKREKGRRNRGRERRNGGSEWHRPILQ